MCRKNGFTIFVSQPPKPEPEPNVLTDTVTYRKAVSHLTSPSFGRVIVILAIPHIHCTRVYEYIQIYYTVNDLYVTIVMSE